MATFQKHQEATPGISSMESIEPASLLEANLRAGVTNENHLQSLGFVMDNGRPRFKIDEPVGTATALNSLRSGSSTLRLTQNSADSEEESFVVLGKDSLCSIQAASSASYAEIQRKSISIDYNSIVSSLTAEETERKLKELLQENVKLKETLNQNNLAMKQQFNTLAAWQEEIMKVHQSHKQKFSETKKLISQLKKENSELRIKASQELITSSDHGLKVKELQEQLQKTLLAEKAVQSVREVELEEANLKLKKELEHLKNSSKVLTSDIQRYTILSNRLSQQLKQADWTIEELKLDLERLELNLKEKEQLASLADYSLLSMPSKQAQESEIWKEKSQRQNKEIEHLKELINSLEQQLKVTSQNSFPSIEIQIGDNGSRLPSEDRLQFAKNVKQYNEILQKLSDCYAKQGSGYIKVQECLIESIDTLKDLEKIKSNEDTGLNRQEKLDKLVDCRTRLNEERLEMINERQELIKAQNQFQKVFSDYNSVLYELEIMHEENAKLSYLQKNNNEATMKPPEVVVNLSEEKKLLEKSEASYSKEKSDPEVEKVREKLQSECESLQLSLNRQKLVQEAEQKSFLAEKKNLDEAVKDLQKKNLNYEQMLKINAEQMDSLKSKVRSLGEQIEKLPILEAQLEIYQSDFHEERQARQNLAVEKDKLVEELVKYQKLYQDTVAALESRQQSQAQRPQDQRRQPSASAPPRNESDTEDLSTPVITAFSCPKCSLAFKALIPLQEHVERCLELQ